MIVRLANIDLRNGDSRPLDHGPEGSLSLSELSLKTDELHIESVEFCFQLNMARSGDLDSLVHYDQSQIERSTVAGKEKFTLGLV